MRLGLQVPNFTWPGGVAQLGADFGRVAERAEKAGFYSFWVMDHFFQIGYTGSAEHEMLECYTALGFAAGRTSRIKLGAMVTGVTYRYPGILLKTATTLDVLSGGRAYLGIGAAWNEEEHVGLGVPFPPVKERFERLEETLKLAHQMFADDERPFHGAHYQLERPLNHPQPVTKPHPPILIGGGGERKTLRFVAEYADACNLFTYGTDAEVKHKLDVLRQHCDEVGRDYDAIEKTAYLVFNIAKDGKGDAMTPRQLIDRLGALADMGFDHVLGRVNDVATSTGIELIGEEVIPQVASLRGSGRTKELPF